MKTSILGVLAVFSILFSLYASFAEDSRADSPAKHDYDDPVNERLSDRIIDAGQGLTLDSFSTYHVRPDGGTSSQCTGLADAAYPGFGTDQACAWNHPFWALDEFGSWTISGGDTILIGPGSYKMGLGAPNTGWCYPEGAYECDLPPLPSGPSDSEPTRILGKGWDQGCPSPPELWGSERPWQVISLEGTDNAEIRCLEITDHSGCVEFHSNPSVRCERDEAPFGDWAAAGIRASNSENVILADLDIHGLAAGGIHAGGLVDWRVENVRIAGNGLYGWDGDIGEDSSNSGTITFKQVTIEWNGCAETYPGQSPNNCWAQTAGGYGDGLGTGATAGDWVFEDCLFRYNTSDGLDLLYHRLGGTITIKRSSSYSNAGDQFKINGDSRIENSLAVSHCGFFSGKPFTYHVDHCRAGGSALAITVLPGNSVAVVNSTIAGEGDCLMIAECDNALCDGTETFTVQNNIFRGYQEFLNSSDTSCYIWFDQDSYYATSFDYNILHNLKMGMMSASANDIENDPLLFDDSLESFDARLKQASPAIDSGLAVGSLGGLIPDHDLEGTVRPQGMGVDRGAYEYEPPTASFTATPLGGDVPLIVSFTDLSSRAPTRWAWSFGDGHTADIQHPVHTYQAQGTFSVSLEVLNVYGTDTHLETDYITVGPCAWQPFRIAGNPVQYFDSFEQACDAAATSGDKIQCHHQDLQDHLVLNQGKSITVQGGYNCDYSQRSDEMTVSQGSITMENGTLFFQ